MRSSVLDTLVRNIFSDVEERPKPRPASKFRFQPIIGKNASIQSIVEGSLLADIELEAIPEYGLQFAAEA